MTGIPKALFLHHQRFTDRAEPTFLDIHKGFETRTKKYITYLCANLMASYLVAVARGLGDAKA